MKIEYRIGDILDTDCRYICHCVNAQGVMRSGVAKDIRNKYPKAFEVYREKYDKDGLTLGSIIGANCGTHIILNLVGQKYYGRDGAVYISYLALRQGIANINRNITQAVAFPMIGCGLAGGNWKLVSQIIEEESTRFLPIVYQFNDRIQF